MATYEPESDLGPGGRLLWESITEEHELDEYQRVQLLEACRQKDRLDELNRIIAGDGVLNLMRFRVTEVFNDPEERNVNVTVKFDSAIDRANATANAMKQLLAALRLPDETTGKKPQYRGARGAQKPTVPGGTVSSLDRARAKAGA